MEEKDDFYIAPRKARRRPAKAEQDKPEKVKLSKEKPVKAKADKDAPSKDKHDNGRGKMPTKTSINLIVKEKSDIRPEIAIPAIVIIIVAAVLLSKFAVVDLLADLSRAQNRVSSAQSQLDADYAEISGYGDLDDRYAHYTYSGLDDTELTTVSRGDILDLLRDQVIPYAEIGSWSVSYNTVSLQLTGSSLQEISQIAQRLKSDSRVEFCTVNAAQSDEEETVVTYTEDGEAQPVTTDDDRVTAQVTIYMMDVVKGAFEE